MFEDLGLRYYGPIDGHDTALLIKTFEFLKTQDEPVILHILTKKGKGYAPALKQPDKFHGLGRYKLETGETTAARCRRTRKSSATRWSNFADSNGKIVAITGAMPTGTGLVRFQKRHPKKYYDVGIAEEHAALFACGLAVQGLKPFLTIYSTFMQRAYDMIIHDIALQNLNVCLCMDRAGLSGDDGPTHHGLFDIGYLRHVPNVVFMQPKDEDEFADMLWTMANHNEGTHRHPLSARRGHGREAQAAAEAAGNRQGRGGPPRRAGRRAARGVVRSGQHVRDGRGSRRSAGKGGRQRGGGQPALDQADGHGHAGVFRAFGGSDLHAGRPCAAQRLRLRGDGASQRGAHPGAGGAAGLAGPVHRTRQRAESCARSTA